MLIRNVFQLQLSENYSRVVGEVGDVEDLAMIVVAVVVAVVVVVVVAAVVVEIEAEEEEDAALGQVVLRTSKAKRSLFD